MSQNEPRSEYSQQDVQQLMYVFQYLENQQNLLSEQLDMLESQIRGVSMSKVTMEGLKGVQIDQEILIPIGSNAFTKAKLMDPQKFLVTISNDMVLEKNIQDAIKSMDLLLESYQNIKNKLSDQLTEISNQLSKIRPQIEQIYEANAGQR